MEPKELLFNIINTLSYPMVILEKEDDEYLVSYVNEGMKNLLNIKEPLELKLPNDFLKVLALHKEKINVNGFTINNIELFNNLYNINVIENSNHLLITFIRINIDELFESISFHDIGSACSAMIIILNEKGEVVDSNECFSSFVGMKKEEIIYKDFFENFIPGNKKLVSHHFKKLISNDSKSQHFITPLEDSNKEIYRINWQVSKIVKQNKNFIIAVGSDISQIIKQNNDFKRELTSIKIGFEYFPFAIGYMDAQGVFTSVNKRFMKMFHIKDENSKIKFEQITFFKKYIDFDEMAENIQLVKEMSYKIKHPIKDEFINIKVDIRMLSGKKESDKLYIIVAQKMKS